MQPAFLLLRRSFSSRLLWGFNSAEAQELKPIQPLLMKDLAEDIATGFPMAYEQLLRALVDKNKEVLESCIEPGAFAHLWNAINELSAQGQKLALVNDPSPIQISLFNASLHIGPFVDRAKNVDMYLFKSVVDDPKMQRVRELHLYKSPGYFSMPQSFILQLDCSFQSKMKLVLEDEKQNVVQGKRDEEPETHVLRFEVSKARVRGFFQMRNNFIRYFRYAADSLCSNPFADEQWIVTDLDNILKGNPLMKDKTKPS